MRLLFSIVSVFVLLLSLVFFYRVGGNMLVSGVILLVLSIHLEIGLRVQASIDFMADELKKITEFIRRVTSA